MSINLTPDQEYFIQIKLQAGKYHTEKEVLEVALRLLDRYDNAEAQWVEDVREKIDAAIAVSDSIPFIDGKTFVNQILERFQQLRQAQK